MDELMNQLLKEEIYEVIMYLFIFYIFYAFNC